MTEQPHSRACDWTPHPHGAACSSNCPTCGGTDPTEPGPALRLIVVDAGDRWDVTAELDNELDEDTQCSIILFAMQTLDGLHRQAHVLAGRR